MDRTPNLLRRTAMVLAALLVVAAAWFPPLQQAVDRQVDAGLQRALISFASARALNGLISVVQGTELSVQPLGVGVTLTLGQALDPVNDLVEQFSSLMLAAAIAFGVQKALLAIGAQGAVSLLLTVLVIAWVAWRWQARPAPPWLTGLLLVLLLTRFAVPLATLGSDFVFQRLLAQDYQVQQAAVDLASSELRELTPKGPASADAKGWWERTKDRIEASVPSLDLDQIKARLENLPERIVGLMVIFLLQTMVLPILLLWALWRLALGALWPRGAIGSA